MRTKFLAVPYLLLVAMSSILTGCDQTSVNAENTEEKMSEFIVGSYAKNDEPGIYRIQLNSKTGALSALSELASTPNPSYLAISADKKNVFAVNETDNGGVTVFNWKTDKSVLLAVSELTNMGDNPCYISISPDGSTLAIANYSSGDIRLFKIEDATLREFARHQHEGQGEHERQEAPHMHWIDWSPDGKFIYAVDLGLDEVSLYQLEGETLLPKKIALKLAPADGPRHMVFSKNQHLAYLVNELSNDVVVMKQDAETGLLSEIQRLSSLPTDVTEESFAAAIKLSPAQDFLYVANRGRNSISVFAIDAQGKLTYLQDQSTGGNWPRDFVISDDGEFLLVANQLSNDITVLKRDNKTGLLRATENAVVISQPTFLSQL